MTQEQYEELYNWVYEEIHHNRDSYSRSKIIEMTMAKTEKSVNKTNDIHIVSSSLRIEDFHIGFEYLQYEMDSERYLNKGMIWKKKKYGFNSPRLHKIKELIDNGEIARCNES